MMYIYIFSYLYRNEYSMTIYILEDFEKVNNIEEWKTS
jgi:hypothetical protein